MGSPKHIMQTKQELITKLAAANLWHPHHLPKSTGLIFDTYRSIVTHDTIQAFPGVLASGLFDAHVYDNLEHPHSPLIIFRSTILEKNPPGSGILASCHMPYMPLDFLRFYHGRNEDWHGCAESKSQLMEKENSGRWRYSKTLV